MRKRPGSSLDRFLRGAVACLLGTAAACGGRTNASGGDGDGGGGGAVGTSGDPCEDYFEAAYAGTCSDMPLPPADELARIQGRFETLCHQTLALPGVTATAASLETCVSAILTDGCNALHETNGPCSFVTGSLAAGVSCVTDAQCQAGYCSLGPAITSACGTCGSVVGLGASCGVGESCGPDAVCYATVGGESCLAIQTVGAGGACPTAQTVCEAGLFCVAAVCTAPAGQGTSCEEDVQCAGSLVCPAAAVPSSCAPPSGAGGPCNGTPDCTAGLVCDATTRQCAGVTWASAGQACGGTTVCLVGTCNVGAGTTGTCPAVIPDGQPCDTTGTSTTTTCDTFATCANETCVLGYPTCP
ncbi:MAG TPA: hypothetical protein VGL81_30985 [Polyangiaceae bacterium]|jgi:hypothetical protein